MKKLADFFCKKSVIIILSIVLGVALIFGGFLWYIYPADKVARGIRVNGISIEGMTVADAEIAIKTGDSLDEQKIIFTDVSGASAEISGLDISLLKDFDKTVHKAYEIGRSGGFFENVKALSWLAFKPQDIGYEYSYDKEKLEKIIYDFGVSVNGELTDYTLEFNNGYVNVSKGVSGQKKDISTALAVACDAIEKGEYDIAVAMETDNPPEPSEKSLIDSIYLPPVNAAYTITDGVINITDEVYGRNVNEEEVRGAIDAVKNGEAVTLKLVEVKPEITRNDLYNQLFSCTLGSFTSRYSTSNKPRTANVVLASKLINGMVLAPGETFSYNKAVGPRTAARGFKEATVYSNGESVPGIGGGICQVSSTLYSAVLYADLEVVERTNHSMTVDYMPKGQDATVSYGTIDFKFRNNTKNPIKISAVPSGGVLTVSIMGTKPDAERTVKITNSIVEVINKTTQDVSDESLGAGETKTLSVGKTGYVVDTYKKVYENGQEVKSEYVSRSRYRMVPQKRAVGAAPTRTPVIEKEDTEILTDENGESIPVFDGENEVTTSPEIEETPVLDVTPAPEEASVPYNDTVQRPQANAETEETEE